uniref:Uncharacterized protein n=1 Tax=Aquisalinus luteolus TaxID=1566827 RepID=A0A8J3A2H6_9PROT|nr:hypothetical protein GCM10011355_18900 [Aquisalinus luteolus]
MHQEENPIGGDVHIHFHQRRDFGQYLAHARDRIFDQAAAMGRDKRNPFILETIKKAVQVTVWNNGAAREDGIE